MWEKTKEKLKIFFSAKTSNNLVFIIVLSCVIILAIIIDQITKAIISSTMEDGQSIPIIKHVLHMTYIKNEGAAFGMFANHRWVFMVISTIAILAIGVYLFGFCKETRFIKIGLAMIIGGGIGNMIDRVILGYVVDMIHNPFVKYYNFNVMQLEEFPIYNIADSCVCVGAAIIFIGILVSAIVEKKQEAKEEK